MSVFECQQFLRFPVTLVFKKSLQSLGNLILEWVPSWIQADQLIPSAKMKTQPKISRHHGNSFSVNCAPVGIVKHAH
jgi:hypothetical protein